MTAGRTSARVVHALDQLDGALSELGYWFSTGEQPKCDRCQQIVPAAAPSTPVRHQLQGQWCVEGLEQ